ncbi:hypothetical protein TTHERM_000201618 (macronuclear) [Tetrahymena thermophila SB210]|uniref:Uncharacterized protein n=1 Tax=Tetrahymena thermophila (strain SB210) TaxID=312017 RepID=W7XB87_TETTS|nr:hypothetical protein TTHERM_000201618 [Tetrahymena thermophila SB210]EWS76645.1 hypothetical protein TTHERM_000201618 [Tetrahymena thermophila SB210]|eukprot:XP_012650813.1 hypothetical protein TTHERM_000201618 [Tetrahymena thermophila SB210]
MFTQFSKLTFNSFKFTKNYKSEAIDSRLQAERFLHSSKIIQSYQRLICNYLFPKNYIFLISWISPKSNYRLFINSHSEIEYPNILIDQSFILQLYTSMDKLFNYFRFQKTQNNLLISFVFIFLQPPKLKDRVLKWDKPNKVSVNPSRLSIFDKQ